MRLTDLPVDDRSRIFSIAAALLVLWVSAPQNVNAEAPSRRPNVVLILADDMGWRDSRVYGSRFYETPHLDQLAAEGVRFTDAYSASPLCSPTRAGLLTGLDPARLRFTSPLGHAQGVVLAPSVPESGPSEQRAVEAESRTRLPIRYYTLAEAMRDAGYVTAHFGKWHLGSEAFGPANQGFEHVSSPGNLAAPPSYFSPYDIAGFADGPEGEHLDERFAEEAVAFMGRHRDEPFFLNFWLFSVHTPLQTRPELLRKYRRRANRRNPQQNWVMAGMIETLDSSVGTLLAGIEALGLKQDTIVIFLSDNGGAATNPLVALRSPPTSNLPLKGGKGQLYEGGIRVPLIMRWSGVFPAGSVRFQIVSTTDLYPTILELTGISPRPAQKFDGISIVQAVQGKPLERDTVFVHFPHYMLNGLSPPGTSLRKGSWKLIRFYADGEEQQDRLELYNLELDPGEEYDVAAGNPATVQELNGLIDDYLVAKFALVPIPNPAFAPEPTRRRGTQRLER